MITPNLLKKLHPEFAESVVDTIFDNNSIHLISMHEDDWFGEGMLPTPELEWHYRQIVDPGSDEEDSEEVVSDLGE